jgi:nucleoside-diphosphate-sugar epimerase
MSPLPSIALAGATGNLGLPILSALLSANYSVTILTRTNGNHSKIPSHPNITVKHVDFTSAVSLTPALQNTAVVISCLTTSAMGAQNPLIDAAVAAGVQRFIPAEFGMDSQNTLAMQLPVCVMKVDTQNHLREQVRLHPEFSWTAVANGLLLDWGLDFAFIADPRKHVATLYNGGDVPFSATNLADVARAVIGIIEHQGETTNRVIYVHSTRVTQNQLIRYAKEKDGVEWDVSVKDTDTIKKESLEELEKGEEADVDAAMLGFAVVAMFDEEYGCDFSGRLDNEVLGVKEMSEKEVRGVVEKFL